MASWHVASPEAPLERIHVRFREDEGASTPAALGPGGDVVVTVLAGQNSGIPLTELEEALFSISDPLTVVSAISELQIGGAVDLQESGSIRLCPGPLPPSILPETEERLLYLRLFIQLAAKDERNHQRDLLITEYLESAHQASAVSHWLQLALTYPGVEARSALERALRLAALGSNGREIGPIREVKMVNNAHGGFLWDQNSVCCGCWVRANMLRLPRPVIST